MNEKIREMENDLEKAHEKIADLESMRENVGKVVSQIIPYFSLEWETCRKHFAAHWSGTRW